MTRDLSKAQFAAALAKYGMKPDGMLGYVRLAPPVDSVHVCRFNAGDRLRDQLAYLLDQQAKQEATR